MKYAVCVIKNAQPKYMKPVRSCIAHGQEEGCIMQEGSPFLEKT